jgi:hypothetical protein
MLWPPPFSKLSPLVGSPNTLKLDFCNRTGEEYKKAIKKHNILHVPNFYGESRLSLLRTCKGFLNLMIVKKSLPFPHSHFTLHGMLIKFINTYDITPFTR